MSSALAGTASDHDAATTSAATNAPDARLMIVVVSVTA
jgi:hypothetical protein